MRLLNLLIALATVAYAIFGPSNLIQANSDSLNKRAPQADDCSPHPGDELQVKGAYSSWDFVPIRRSPQPDNLSILNDLIDAHKHEKRIVNLSRMNNPAKGLLPRACRNDPTCPCARRAKTVL